MKIFSDPCTRVHTPPPIRGPLKAPRVNTRYPRQGRDPLHAQDLGHRPDLRCVRPVEAKPVQTRPNREFVRSRITPRKSPFQPVRGQIRVSGQFSQIQGSGCANLDSEGFLGNSEFSRNLNFLGFRAIWLFSTGGFFGVYICVPIFRVCVLETIPRGKKISEKLSHPVIPPRRK